MSAPIARGAASKPPGLVVLALIVALEAVGTGLIATLALLASPGADGVTSGVAVGVFVGIFAVLLIAVAVGLFRARSWTWTATLVWQLVQALVGAYSLQGAGANLAFGALAVGLAVVALVLLFTRAVRVALGRG